MQFSVLSIITLAAVAAAAPSGSGSRTGTQKRTTSGGCNGTSCKVGFVNYECNEGSCVGEGGGDGADCTVVDNDDGSTTAFCPVGCPDDNLC
ncbi:hypothetical protein F4780DRAFT_784797 [Xylariomycetidae sp. FL0641]|nr:hypothetical protein F4780DRAFT_784797 [Xylariomycetidae sp. FL0641]